MSKHIIWVAEKVTQDDVRANFDAEYLMGLALDKGVPEIMLDEAVFMFEFPNAPDTSKFNLKIGFPHYD